jgi:hypothetical protein
MTRDILTELAGSGLDLATAVDIVDNIVGEYHAGTMTGALPELLHMSTIEYSAFAHGAPLDVLAGWRSDGWPTTCGKCHAAIAVNEFGWLPREVNGVFCLVHITCPPSLAG